MKNQRLRNLTTGILHTKVQDIYMDVEYLVGERGVMTHMLPNMFRAITPWLKQRVTEARFWDEKFDVTHDGDTEIEPMTELDRKEFWDRYQKLPHPFANLRP